MTLIKDLRDFLEINPIDLQCSLQFVQGGKMNLKIESPIHLMRAGFPNLGDDDFKNRGGPSQDG